jgi:penicillin-binding protein 2
VQIVQGAQFRELSEGNRLRERVALAPRGEILDRNGDVLARSTASFRLLLTPIDVPKGQLEKEVRAVADLLSLSRDLVAETLKKFDARSVQPLVLASGLTQDQAVLFETKSLEFPGMAVVAVPVRQYTSSQSFAHVLGTTGAISDGDSYLKDPAYSPLDVVGKTGLEAAYEKELKGLNGKDLVEVDATGGVVKDLGDISSTPGHTLRLTIDKGLQEELYSQFALRPGAKGAAIALDPKTGAVLALLSYPSFDSNAFSGGISTTEYKKLTEDPLLPLFNRAVGAQLPPGSTVKPMVALAGLESGVITEHTVIVDNGKISIPNQFNPSVVYDYVGWKRTGLGPMTVRSAIAMSSDIFFYVVGGGLASSRIDGLGVDRLTSFYHKFHLGSITGIDIPGEKPGLVPDPAWKLDYFRDNAVLGKWYLGDTYHISIGQGDVLVTPLQVALWTATIANNGVGMKPHIVDGVYGGDQVLIRTISPEVLVPKVGSDANIRVVQEGMRQTVLAGTAKRLQSLPISAAGKTGTAQFDNNEKEHSWFTSFAPYEDPQIVVTVLVEGGGEGGAAALPITQDALAWWVTHRYHQK